MDMLMGQPDRMFSDSDKDWCLRVTDHGSACMKANPVDTQVVAFLFSVCAFVSRRLFCFQHKVRTCTDYLDPSVFSFIFFTHYFLYNKKNDGDYFCLNTDFLLVVCKCDT